MEAVRIDPALVWGGGGCGLTALSRWRRVDAVSDVVVHVSIVLQSLNWVYRPSYAPTRLGQKTW